MAEASLLSQLSDEEEERTGNTVSSPKSTHDAREKMASGQSKKSSSRKSSGRSKKKDNLEELEKKWESRFSQIDTRLDKFFDLFSARENLSGTNSANKDTVTSGEQRPCESLHVQDSGSVGAHRLVEDSPVAHSPADLAEENGQSDVVSLAPGRNERQDIGLLSDDDSVSVSMRGENDTRQKHSARFSKYVKCSVTDNTDENNNDHLKSLFGDDAKAKTESSSVGLILDNSQIDILSGSWRTKKKTEKLTAYNEEYRTSFPVHDKSVEHLEVPSIDKLTSDLLVKKHGNKAFSMSKKNTLHTPFLKSIEKLAYQGQVASRMGIITASYIQQALATLLETVTETEVNLDKTVQLVRDIFAMSTKSLDQAARTGAFHHLVRRKAVMEDTGLSEIKELKNPLIALPLSNSGVFGETFEQTLKDRVEKNKQLKELLPELHVNKSFPGKRKGNTGDWPNKRQKTDNAQSNANTNNKFTGGQRSFQRTSTVTRPEKDEKNEKSGTTTGSNFRRFNTTQGKGQQKK